MKRERRNLIKVCAMAKVSNKTDANRAKYIIKQQQEAAEREAEEGEEGNSTRAKQKQKQKVAYQMFALLIKEKQAKV